VFPRLSVLDNLLAGCHTFAWSRDLVADRIERALASFPRLPERLDQLAGTLSGGEQQMLGLAKALLLEPRLLLIDELSLGLAPVVVAELGGVLERLKAAGTTMVVVEQSHSRAVALADRVVWLDKGAVRRSD
jgi:branched-chain amino acid transport system ATP-binding protein